MKNLAVQMSRPELKSKWMLMCQKKLLNVIIDIVVQWDRGYGDQTEPDLEVSNHLPMYLCI